MQKEDLLKRIAKSGYNVGFGAKKHFATFDIVQKVPGLIGFLSMAIGIIALYVDSLATKNIAAFLTVSGIAAIIINQYDNGIEEYEEVGKKLIQIFNDLYSLYLDVKASDKEDLSEYQEKLKLLESSFYSNCISRQILLSDWYAHYKFFWQHQIDWIDEQLEFRFWRDKVPLSFVFSTALITVLILCLIWSA